MIKAVIFDFGNVVSRFDLGVLVKNVQRYTALAPPDVMKAFTDGNLIRLYETGEISTDEFLSSVIDRGRFEMTKEALISAYSDMFQPIPTTGALIRALKPRYKVGLLSNTNELHFENVIRQTDVFGLFDTVTLSFEVKVMKPAKEIYDDALAKLRLAPGECIFVDDLKENIEAANTMGFVGIHYTSHSELMTALREYLPVHQ